MKEPIIIKDISKSNGDILRIEVSEYKGVSYLNLRMWYTDKDGELRPTKKGVAVTKEDYELLKAAILDAESKF
ncbi:MAG: transcriptional coactivator p15/PC4 family protein [Leptospiraceae bacterium]|nr:transcriptional coactivator p15/PC4 family protein [Leptospiraceae bacterium]MCP5493658.1 transcriptional coactivator p15/PC4 family protein [Leptospiraceae bacterium]